MAATPKLSSSRALCFFLFFCLCLVALSAFFHARPVSAARFIGGGGGSHLVFRGVDSGLFAPRIIRLGRGSSAAASGGCEATYGFLPCTTNALGNVFLILVYGYLMFLAATFLSNGSELLMQILGPGLIGGLLLPMLGALPDAMLILGKSPLFFFWLINFRVNSLEQTL